MDITINLDASIIYSLTLLVLAAAVIRRYLS